MTTVRKNAHVILDGTVLPIGPIAADRPYCSGKKKHHGMNVQVRAHPAGRLIWASDALPGATHDLTATRVHGIPAALAENDIKCWADKAYQGAGPAIRVPIRGKHLRGWRQRHNCDHAKIRSLGKRAMAILKSWRLLRKLRCSTTRITPVRRPRTRHLIKMENAPCTFSREERGAHRRQAVRPIRLTSARAERTLFDLGR